MGVEVGVGARVGVGNSRARVGFDVKEELITPEADLTLTDNATGSANYAAKGAHRLKISLNLKKLDFHKVIEPYQKRRSGLNNFTKSFTPPKKRWGGAKKPSPLKMNVTATFWGVLSYHPFRT